MKHAWRWFGPVDVVSIEDIEQAGASGVVSALHHIPNGIVWSLEEISKRQAEIGHRADGSVSSLNWEVVESLPVSEEIKKQDRDWRDHIANYKTSLENLARAGIEVVCYNFMPVLDWTRTDLAWRLQNGSTCMRFDLIDFAVFDMFVLKRKEAERDFPSSVKTQAKARFDEMTNADRENLAANIVQGLPGANQELNLTDLHDLLTSYDLIGGDRLKSNLHVFLEEVAPVAQKLGMRLCCHPDDPPFPLLGLPRIVSTEADYREMIEAVDLPANGITLCSGSLGANPHNDLPGMMRRLGHRVHFLHLRNVRLETELYPGSFHESAHLDGNVDMIALMTAIHEEEGRRRAFGLSHCEIPMRPDHGHQIADDFNRSVQPGYPYTGRLRGLAELRGVEMALSHGTS